MGLAGALSVAVTEPAGAAAGPPAAGAPARGDTRAENDGAATERLWLLGGLGLALAASGVVAVAALRGRGNYGNRCPEGVRNPYV
ncbi:hypothetical protein RGF97_14455 [Streptomyces roseicoloratus]|uniref:Uncharacterized protein n=1 Tax=Streptomyces roseicoloratus TaxID=2508722 RepID=A0ABY9RUE3_9ACTN|nr:hypothetical protein [Streptomyces roseicoloratus]WMX45819.1 hypothetical protein RGF97_14455 [Streptomyces roseicoloratus]